MAVCYSTRLSDTARENRWAAEFHRPAYKFVAKNPEDWRKIGKCSKFCQYGLSIKMNDIGRGVPIYRLNEIEGCFLSDNPSKYAPISPLVATDYTLEKQDILFCRTNGNINYVGRTGMFLGDNKAVFASYLVRVRTYSDQLVPEYLIIYLNTEFGRRQILRRAMQSNQVNVSASELKRIDAFLAPPEAQKVVAELVQSAYKHRSEGISSYKQAQQILEVELGLDKMTFHKPVGYTAQCSELETSHRADAEFFNPELRYLQRELEKSLSLKPLPEYADVFKFSNPPYGTEGIPIITQKHLGNIAPSDYEDDLVAPISWALGNPLAVLRKNDLLYYSVGAYLGKTNQWLSEEKAVHASFITMLRCHTETDAGFLQVLLNSHYGILQSKCFQSGTSQPYIYPKDIRRFLVPVIPQALRVQIHNLVVESYEKGEESKKLIEQAKVRVEQIIEEAIQS